MISAPSLPAVLQERVQLRRWVTWRIEQRNGKATKVPYDPHTGKHASTTDPTTWADYETACRAWERYQHNGIGFVFVAEDDLVGIDLDECRNPHTGGIDPWAQEIVDRINSYTETSPSGTGVHILLRGSLPPGRRRQGLVEVYDRERYFTVTGDHLPSTPDDLVERSDQLVRWHAEVFGAQPTRPNNGTQPNDSSRNGHGAPLPDIVRQTQEHADHVVLKGARDAKNGQKFSRLFDNGDWQAAGYPSQSEADMALVAMLAFWTGPAPAHIDRLFRRSKLYRPEKWDRPTYRNATIRKVLDAAEFRSVGRPPPSEPGQSARLALGLGEFLGEQFPPPTPLIEGLLTDDGGGWIAGEEKLGKTLYALHESLCVGMGVPVLGQYRVPERHRVLVIEEEDSPRRTQRRVAALLRGLGFDPDDPALRAELNDWFRLSVWQGLNLDHTDWIARLEAEIIEHRPAVVYLDALRKLTGRDLNKAVEATALLQTLDRLRREHGVIFRVLHHHRKIQTARAGRGSQELAGSYVLGAWAENSMFFEPLARRQGPVKVEVQSKDLAPMPAFKLVIESEGPAEAPTHLRLRAEPLGDSDTREQSRQAILDQLRVLPPRPSRSGGQGVTATDIATALKLHESTVRARLRELEQRHLARRAGVWTRPAGPGARDVVLWVANE